MDNIEWIEPITNRTNSNTSTLENSLINNEKANVSIPLIEEILSVNDAKRIENNTQFIINKLQSFGISIQLTTCMEWSQEKLLLLNDVNRINENIIKIVDFLKINPSPIIEDILVPESIKSFRDVNEIEKILLKLKMILDNVKYGFRISDTFYANQKIELPMYQNNRIRVRKYAGNVEAGKFPMLSLPVIKIGE